MNDLRNVSDLSCKWNGKEINPERDPLSQKYLINAKLPKYDAGESIIKTYGLTRLKSLSSEIDNITDDNTFELSLKIRVSQSLTFFPFAKKIMLK